MIKVWGRNNSVNVQKATWCLEELKVPYERVDAGMQYGVVNTPEFRKMNPNGLVPVIEDAGTVLWESNAIVRYLAARHGAGTLWPGDLRLRADADRWMEWQSTTFTPAMRDAFLQAVRVPADKRDPAMLEASRAATEKAAAILDAHLAGREFVAGDAFSPADIVLGCAAHRWLHLPITREPRPQLERWYAALGARPGARQVVETPVR